MKKNYILAMLMISGAYSFAQLNQELPALKSKSVEPINRTVDAGDRAPGDVIGEIMDFSDPTNWIINNDEVDGEGWVIGPDGPSGFFSGGMGAISSTSGGNFALFDADGNAGTGTITMADPVDLTGIDVVAIEFESYYRNFTGQAFVEISIDGGTTWTSYQVHEFLPLNESTANFEFVSINISALAAGESDVRVQFKYVSTDDYAWMVDDVRFAEGYSNQLILGQTYFSGGEGAWDYYMIPSSQATEYTFGARVSNGGVIDQTNTSLNVVANDGGADVYDELSAPVTVDALTNDSLQLLTAMTFPASGSYVLDYAVASADFVDEAPSDNVRTLEPIMVGTDLYARDNGVPTGSVGFLGATPVTTVCANFFEFFGDFSFGAVEVDISDESGVGEQIYVEIRRFDGTEYVFEASSDDYTLEAGDPGSTVRIQLDDIINCSDGDAFAVGVGHYGSSTIRFMTAQTAEGAVIYNEGAASQQNSVFMIRLAEEFSSVDENEALTGLDIYPNPAVNQANIVYNLSNEAAVNIKVTDVSGKVILTENLGSQVAGQYTKNINTAEMAEGVYFYTLTVDGEQTTKKLIVSRN